MHDGVNGYYWHNGATSFFNSFMAFNDNKTVGIVILCNLGPNEGIPMTVIGNKILKEINNRNSSK